MKTFTAVSTLALAVAAPFAAKAQVYDLGEIVVSANLEAVAADRTGATVTIVDAEALAAGGETRLTEVLQRLPGVTVNTRGPLGTNTGISVRGASQNYVAVLVDGIDVTDPSGTQVAYDFGGLTTADISRIEVLKGSQSALYGSRAVGGVISITTRRAVEEGVRHYVEAEAGSHSTRALSYGLTAKGANHDVAVTLSHVSTDGFSAADEADGNTEADGYRENKLSFNGSVTLDNGARIGASGFVSASRGEYDEGFPLADGSPDEVMNRNAKGLRAFAEFQTGAIDNTLAVTWFHGERRFREDSGFGPSDNTYTGRRLGLSWQGATDLGDHARFVFGADTTKEEFESAGTFGAATADSRISGVFAEMNYAATDSIDLSATVRHDNHSRFGGHTTGRVALAWRIEDDLILRAQAGTGFRAPSNYELFSLYGDPALEPEKAAAPISASKSVMATAPRSAPRPSGSKSTT
ncbi:MAG: TonB-dependent receptor [Paracoccaceae bacterium]